MNEWGAAAVGILVGLALGGAAVALWLQSRRSGLHSDLVDAKARTSVLEQAVEAAQGEIKTITRQRDEHNARRESSEREAAQLTERLRQRDQQFADQQKLLADAEKRLGDVFASLGSRALAANNQQFIELAKAAFETLMKDAKGDIQGSQQAIDNLVKPIRELLDKQNNQLTELEKKREVAYKGVEEQIKAVTQMHEKVGEKTDMLVNALRRPEQRGRWGEMQLRNCVELAGMTQHCDFTEQAQTDDPNTRDRPDMIIHMPGGGVIVVDSKVALDAYLDALQPQSDRKASMLRHADHVESHYKRLSSKKYWNQFERTPKLVVMFMPLESALTAALEIKPNLHADAMCNHVLIATPTLLVATLRAVAYGWQQDDVAANAREIAAVGKELYDRLATFTSHFKKIGSALDGGVKAYNEAVGSLESRVLISTRKLRELHSTTSDEIESPALIEKEPRQIIASDLQLPAPSEQGTSSES